jgi:Zn-dependent protease with chaperone function
MRRSCLAGVAVSYLPVLAGAAVVAVLAVWGGALRTVLWLAAALVIGYAYISARTRQQRLQHRGVQVTAQDQPELMAVVDGITERAGIRRLDGVWVMPGGNAQAVVGRRDWLGRRHVGVAVGLLLAAHLSAEEVAAVLAHEAGHLTDPHQLRLLLGQRRQYARTKLERRAAWPLWWYWSWFLRLTREQGLDIERHADAVAAQMCGAQTAARAQHRAAEAGVVHEIAMRRFVWPWWERRIAPATLFEAYEAVWTRAAAAVGAGLDAEMSAPDQSRDTHPGLAERCGGQRFPLSPALRGDLALTGLAELDRRCAASLRQQQCRYPMQTLSWAEIRAERDRRDAERRQESAGAGEGAEVTPAPG